METQFRDQCRLKKGNVVISSQIWLISIYEMFFINAQIYLNSALCWTFLKHYGPMKFCPKFWARE